MVSKDMPNVDESSAMISRSSSQMAMAAAAMKVCVLTRFGLKPPLHVWHLFSVLHQLHIFVNQGSGEALFTEGCVCGPFYFFNRLSSS